MDRVKVVPATRKLPYYKVHRHNLSQLLVGLGIQPATPTALTRNFQQTVQIAEIHSDITTRRSSIARRPINSLKFEWSKSPVLLPSKIPTSYKKVMLAESLKQRSNSAQRNSSGTMTSTLRRINRRNSTEAKRRIDQSPKNTPKSRNRSLVIEFPEPISFMDELQDSSKLTDRYLGVRPRALKLNLISEVKEICESEDEEVGHHMTPIEFERKPARAQTAIEAGRRRKLKKKRVRDQPDSPLCNRSLSQVEQVKLKGRPVNIRAVVPRVLEVTSV